jgi:hypothetical protein
MNPDLLAVVEYVLEREAHWRDDVISAFGADSDIVQNHIATKALRLLAAAEPVADDTDRAYGPHKGQKNA